ncbi:MAG TPA: hypothetical protein VK788_12295 [Terriglobales bacterium]|nr:hypothetical protein [Terriglobales bacterium]
MSLYPASIPRCEHLKVNGTQCGSPALRRNHFCYFHKHWQETRIVLNANRARRGRAALDLPVLEDANSIQVSLMQVMRLILSGQLDPKTAGLLLYALQTASSNLGRTNFEPVIKTRVVIDPRTVDQTPLGEDPWCEEDFEEEDDDEEDEVSEPVEAKSEDFGEDKEWTAEVPIPDIEAQAEAAEKAEQIIPQIQAVASVSIRPHRTPSPGRPRQGGLSHADRNSTAQWASVPRYPPI